MAEDTKLAGESVCDACGPVGEDRKQRARDLAVRLEELIGEYGEEEMADACLGCLQIVAIAGLATALRRALAIRFIVVDDPGARIRMFTDGVAEDALAIIRDALKQATHEETRH